MLKTSPRFDRYLLISSMEDLFEYRRWVKEIPALQFPPDMLVRIIPPFSGAVVRFLVSYKDHPNTQVSVYLDCYDLLGAVGEPYWEVYPYQDDVMRVPMMEADKLMTAIKCSLNEQVQKVKE